MSVPAVDILLAAYNGARFIRDQIESILMQTFGGWRLLIRDDGSSDSTRQIIREFAERYPERIFEVRDGLGRLGPSGNFNALLEISDSDYAMFCDQDDIWLPEKIEVSLHKMREVEVRTGPDTPVLVHTDLRLVDSECALVAESAWKYWKLMPEKAKKINRLIVEGRIWGCTIIINRKLREMALPIPEGAIMHDWWVALSACSFGIIEHVPEPTILYSIHGNNHSGVSVRRRRHPSVIAMAQRLFSNPGAESSLRETTRHAAAFYDRFAGSLDPGKGEIIRSYAGLGSKGPLARRYAILKYRMLKTGLKKNIRFLLHV